MSEDKIKVVITDTEFGGVEVETKVFDEIGAEVVVLNTMDEETIIKATKDADAVMTEYAKITARVIAGFEKCKVISRYGIGVDMIDLDAAARAGIPVVNAPDYGIEEVATHTAALILCMARKVAVYDRALKAGQWGFGIGKPVRRLQGEVLGLIGFGNIGRMTAKFMYGLGMNVIAYDPYILAGDMALRGVRKAESMEELLKTADIVSLHVPLLESTRGMIGEKELKMMKPEAYLINTGRGGLVDENALVTALKEKRIAGAAIDTHSFEPLQKDNLLVNLDNVIMTPHCAFYSEESLLNIRRIPSEEVVRVIRGQKPRNLVNGKQLIKCGNMDFC